MNKPDLSNPMAILAAVQAHPGYPEELPEGWRYDDETFPTHAALSTPDGMVAISEPFEEDGKVVQYFAPSGHAFIRAEFGELDLGLVRE